MIEEEFLGVGGESREVRSETYYCVSLLASHLPLPTSYFLLPTSIKHILPPILQLRIQWFRLRPHLHRISNPFLVV